MEEIIKGYIERAYPQLISGLCWPRYGQVTGIADPPTDGGLCDEFRPMYAVDVQLLNNTGDIDSSLPPLLGVPMSMPAGGSESGILSLPKEGTTVVVQFLNGSPHKPVVTAVLPHGLSLAACGPGQSIWQGGPGATQLCSAEGDWQRSTIGGIADNSYSREIIADNSITQVRDNQTTILENDKKMIGGNSEQTVAGKITAAAAGDITVSTAGDLKLAAAGSIALVCDEASEVISTLKTIKAKSLYIGDQSDNTLQLLSELMTATANLASALNVEPIAKQIQALNIRLSKMIG